MPRITFNTPDAMSDYINTQIQTGKYDNVSEYLRDLIRHDQERKEAAHTELRALLHAAESSGISHSTLDDTRKKVHEQLVSDGFELQE